MNFKNIDEFNNYLKNKKIAIIGLGVSNLPLIDYLKELTDNITLFDSKNKDKINPDIMDKVHEYGLRTSFGNNYLNKLIGFDVIFRSPSCLPTTKELLDEIERGAFITTEVEMVVKLAPCKIIGITGSDGKTTTTTLTHEVLKNSGYNCYLGGNIGYPIFTKLKEMTKDDLIILELSSFQLMNCDKSVDYAAVTNISPNHLDIHSSYKEYIDAKKNIYVHQNREGLVVINYDNQVTKDFIKDAKGTVRYFSSKTNLRDGFIVKDGSIWEMANGKGREIIKVTDLKLRGNHNYENICTCLSLVKDLVPVEKAISIIKDFKGVEHRLEYVREVKGASWYNDSASSSPSRTVNGLNAFSEPIILIAGGYDKNLSYEPLATPIIEKVKSLILIGDNASKIEEVVRTKDVEGKVEIYRYNLLEEAVKKAYEVASEKDIVLLSPASTSFDMKTLTNTSLSQENPYDLFKNAYDRGDKFKEIVNKL